MAWQEPFTTVNSNYRFVFRYCVDVKNCHGKFLTSRSTLSIRSFLLMLCWQLPGPWKLQPCLFSQFFLSCVSLSASSATAWRSPYVPHLPLCSDHFSFLFSKTPCEPSVTWVEWIWAVPTPPFFPGQKSLDNQLWKRKKDVKDYRCEFTVLTLFFKATCFLIIEYVSILGNLAKQRILIKEKIITFSPTTQGQHFLLCGVSLMSSS